MFFTDFFFYSFSFFQNPATPAAYGIQDLHNFVTLWLVIVFFPVLSMLSLTSKEAFYSKRNKNYHITLVEKMYLNTFFHNPKLEIIWTVLPAIILVIIVIPSFALLYAIDETIDPVKTVKAIGNQWFWEYEFFSKEKKNIISSYIIPTKDLVKGSPRLLDVDNPLILKSYQHIRILITSNDVLHSWAVPSLGIKLDAVPGRLNQTNLYLLRPGVFYGQCSELCGVGHEFMPIKVVSYSFIGFFLDSKVDDYIDKKRTNPFDWQVLCGLLSLILTIILLFIILRGFEKAGYDPKLMIYCSFLFTHFSMYGLSMCLEPIFSYFLGYENFLMKLNIGTKFILFTKLCYIIQMLVVIYFYQNYEYIYLMEPRTQNILVILVMLLGLWIIIAFIIYSARTRYAILVVGPNDENLTFALNIVKNLSLRFKWQLPEILSGLLALFVCVQLRDAFSYAFEDVLNILGLSFISKLSFNGLILSLGWPYIFERTILVIVLIIFLVLILSYKFLSMDRNRIIYGYIPVTWHLFLVRKFDRLVELRLVLLTNFLLNIARCLFITFLLLNAVDSIIMWQYEVPLVFFLLFVILGVLFNLGKFYYELHPKIFSRLIDVHLPLFTSRNTRGFCRDPLFLHLRYNEKKQCWENRFFSKDCYFHNAHYCVRFNLNFRYIVAFFNVISFILVAIIQVSLWPF